MPLEVAGLSPMVKYSSPANHMSADFGKPTHCALKWGNAQVMFYSAERLRALLKYLKDRAEVAWQLEEMPYGMLEFAIRDCNGYILSFGQEV
jgi:hypothetical protein